jgi:hypothetical protein
MTKKIALIFCRTIFYLPISFVLIFWIYVFALAIHLGHIPQYDVDDQYMEGWVWLYNFTWLLLFAAFYGGIFCLIYISLKIFFRKIPLHVFDVIIFGAGVLFFLVTFSSRAMEWYLD